MDIPRQCGVWAERGQGVHLQTSSEASPHIQALGSQGRCLDYCGSFSSALPVSTMACKPFSMCQQSERLKMKLACHCPAQTPFSGPLSLGSLLSTLCFQLAILITCLSSPSPVQSVLGPGEMRDPRTGQEKELRIRSGNAPSYHFPAEEAVAYLACPGPQGKQTE